MCGIHIIISILVITLILIASTRQEQCVLKQRGSIPYSLFSVNNEPLETVGKAIYISTKERRSNECTLSLKRIVEILNFPEHKIIGLFHFTCVKKLRIHFNAENTTKLENVISYFQLDTCIIAVEDLDEIGGLTDLRVVTFFHSDIETRNHPKINEATRCSGLNKSVSLWIDVEPETNPPDLFSLLDCQNAFPEMAEVTFTNMSWGEIPNYIQNKFPNLQSLELPYNSMKLPPDFPWTDSIVTLPANLTRSPYFQDHYSSSFHLDIPADIFRRILVLDNNNITDLTNYTFYGLLHMLSMKSNGLKHIGEDTMASVQELQTLILSYNELTNIPETVFRNLNSLKHLDLRYNNLTFLKTATFSSLFNLRYLNLAHNMISNLENGVFSYVTNLEELHLEFNFIKTLPRDFIPEGNIKLSYIYLNNNPVAVFPDIFLLQNIKKVDLSWTEISFDNFSQIIEEIPLTEFRTRVRGFDRDPNKDSDMSPNKRCEINLSHSNIRRVGIEPNITQKASEILILLLKHFWLILDNNPILCDCNILPFTVFAGTFLENEMFRENQYFFKSWNCYSPKEFRGRNMFQIQADETYCTVNISFCPSFCECSHRHGSDNIIVDCRSKGLDRLPDNLPDGSLELWFQQNKISELRYRDYFYRIKTLYLSGNNVAFIENGDLLAMESLRELRLDRNRLAYLHKDVMQLSQTVFHIEHNPFRCDCKSIWMKMWILKEKASIRDWNNIVCNTEKGNDGEQFVLVPDGEFVCQNNVGASSGRRVITYVILFVCSIVVTILIVILSWFLVIRGRSEKYQFSIGLEHQKIERCEKNQDYSIKTNLEQCHT